MTKAVPTGDLVQNDHTPGSPSEGEPEFIAVGRLRASHGVKGEISMQIYTDFPERLHPGGIVYIGEQHLPLQITSKRPKDKLLLLSFKGYEDIDHVNVLRNAMVYTKTENLPALPEGQYYHHQLIGLNVMDETGGLLGKLVEIIETGANDVYIVRAEDGSEILLPAIESAILKIDLEIGAITARPPEWL